MVRGCDPGHDQGRGHGCVYDVITGMIMGENYHGHDHDVIMGVIRVGSLLKAFYE